MRKIKNLKSAFGALAVAALVFFGLGFGATAANAHAELTGSNPIADSVIGSMPPAVELTFGEKLMVMAGSEAANQITVTNEKGERVDSKNTTVAERVASVEIAPDAAEGTYTVGYRVVSEDGHPIEGSFKFEVSVAAQSGAATPVPISELPEDAPTAVIAPAPEPRGVNDGDADLDGESVNPWPWIITGAFVVIAAGAGVFVIRRRR